MRNPTQPGRPASGGPSVLVAHADAWLRSTLDEALRRAGFRVAVAADGCGAWEAFHHLAGDLDLLIAEARLPGLDATALARRLRVLDPHLPALVLDSDPEPAAVRFYRQESLRLARLPLPLDALARRAQAELFRARHVRSWPATAPYAVA